MKPNETILNMVNAAVNGKINDFEASFKTAMADKVLAKIGDIKAELGASVKIDGEVSNGEPATDAE